MKILPNGQVQIQNDETGETKIVPPEQLSDYGIDPKQYEQQVSMPTNIKQRQVNLQKDIQSTQTAPTSQYFGGSTPLPQPTASVKPKQPLSAFVIQDKSANKPITTTGRSLEEYGPAIQKARESGNKAAEEALIGDYNREYSYQKDFGTKKAAEIKKDDAAGSMTNFINNLEKHYQTAGGASFGNGPMARVGGAGKSLEGVLGFNDSAKTYNDEKSGFAATLKSLTGDTGVLTDQDFARLSKLLPKLGATPGEATNKFNDLRSQLTAKFGGEKSETTIKPKSPTGVPLIGSAVKIAQDNAAGINANLTEKSRNESNTAAFKQAEILQNKASNETDPTKKKAFLQQANQLLGQVGKAEGDISKSFSDEIGNSTLRRSLTGGAEIASVAELPAIISGVKKLATKGLPEITSKFTVKGASAARGKAAAESTAQHGGDDLIVAAEKYVKNDPTAANLLEKVRPALKGKSISTEDLLDKLQVWNKAYSAAGKVGASNKAGLYDALSKAAREELSQKAPEVFKAHQALKAALGRANLARKIINPITIGSAIVGTGAAIGTANLLNKK